MKAYEVIMNRNDGIEAVNNKVMLLEDNLDPDETIAGPTGLIWDYYNIEEYYVQDIIELEQVTAYAIP